MGKSYIEKRVIAAGRELCELRMGLKGKPITADDIRSLSVKTFPPLVQWMYGVLGAVIFVFGMWVQLSIGNMAVSMGLVLIGFLNVVFGVHGRPRKVAKIAGLDLMELTNEILNSFVESQDAEREKSS
ncbi:MAG: hypothetical protein CBD18_01370 [Opitutales bacterium TMED158]|nr:MAG: hypothetical protein CBD18_01370 [Opitutales bacterium TMED158]